MLNLKYVQEKSMVLSMISKVIGSGPNGYTVQQYDAIKEYLWEIVDFKECWEKIYTGKKLRFGTEPSDLARKYTLPLLEKFKGQTVWELGAGTGRDSIFLSKYCKDVTSVEISKTATDDTKEQMDDLGIHNINVINDDVWSALKMQNNIKKGFVDVVHAHSFLHYTKPVMTDIVFSEMHDLLNEGGKIVFGVKGKGDHLFAKGKEVEKDVWVHYDGQRRRFYDEESIRLVLENASFTVDSVQTEKENFDNNVSEFVICVATKN